MQTTMKPTTVYCDNKPGQAASFRDKARKIYFDAIHRAAIEREAVAIFARENMVWTSCNEEHFTRHGWRLICWVDPDSTQHRAAIVTRPGKEWGVSQHRAVILQDRC